MPPVHFKFRSPSPAHRKQFHRLDPPKHRHRDHIPQILRHNVSHQHINVFQAIHFPVLISMGRKLCPLNPPPPEPPIPPTPATSSCPNPESSRTDRYLPKA